jgi:hypothetical protein
VATTTRPDALLARRAGAAIEAAARIHDALTAGRSARLALGAGVDEARAEELIADVRAGRRRTWAPRRVAR